MTQPELTVGTPRHHWPFSRGLVVESLVNAGASGAVASAAARRVEQQLRNTRRSPVSPAELQALMVEVARDVAGGEVAEAAARQTPAFFDILVTAKKGTLPFSRGVLARTLEDTGLSPRDAYGTASAVDVQMRQAGRREISVRDLDALTEQTLAERYGEHLRLTYRFLQRNRGKLGVVSADGGAPVPFSKGLLVQSLLAAGVAPDVARKVARVTQRDLRGSEDRLVTRQAVREKVETLLLGEVGPDVSARYRLLRVIRRPPRPLVVLLGGVSGTGKSYLAAEVAYRLGITRVIGTDAIRQVMRAMVSPELVPGLHASTFNAWEALLPPGEPHPENPTRAELLAGFRDQVQQVNVGVGAVVRRSIEEGTSLVLEGVHLVPGYLRAADYAGALVVPLLVTLPDEAEHRRHFEARDAETAASRPLHRYMRYFREIRIMQDYLEELAAREDVPLLDGLTLDESADQAVDVVLRRVMAALTPGERAALLGEREVERGE
ncbi:2-phosphoglycerate kinase [Deinococcus metallilatus]|uniref:2-phosphoglycerate kinase n=2 Tax=Deinococcus TaxID=1298 RepID=A0AAJ5F2Z4_9DEIO|nr:2-phosphoglycerate kinase [Deinococcus metallilatus]MBB5295462.1 2-phosphoglycerate kinase [Deinococcus metallilatus]QBY08018.1 2-phosphoglycerate kinase [Deinococcus metallilatus]RXJ12911.1 2-phosphoglycerate kinase [Deinococcus metallilatus]TLK27166.1 2-phosphoglycerate kinase [Deinococcus metallilatus]GMA16140.1 2-phosphoglycerate kinase [Deinococcus metallilatus]